MAADPAPQQQHVTVIDYSTALSQARRLSDHPCSRPPVFRRPWRPSNVTTSGGNGKPVVFHLGFVTPAGHYAPLEESDGPQAAYLAGSARASADGLDSVR